MPGQLTLALLQHACPTDASPQDNIDRCIEMIRDAAGQDAQLVVTQELFASAYFPQVEDEAGFDLAEPIPGQTSIRLAALAKELGITISASLFEKRAAGVYHNTTLTLGPDGSEVGRYRKMHIPDDPRFYEKYYFTPGDLGWQTFAMPSKRGRESFLRNTPIASQQATVKTTPDPFLNPTDPSSQEETAAARPIAGPRVGTLVCWDQWFPEAARLTALRGAELLLYPTAIGYYNDAEQGEPLAVREQQRDAWVTVMRSHAISNGIFVATANRIGTENDLTFWGSSFICGPDGAILAQASTDQPEVLLAQLDLDAIESQRRGWPFLRDRRIDAYAGLLGRLTD